MVFAYLECPHNQTRHKVPFLQVEEDMVISHGFMVRFSLETEVATPAVTTTGRFQSPIFHGIPDKSVDVFIDLLLQLLKFQNLVVPEFYSGWVFHDLSRAIHLHPVIEFHTFAQVPTVFGLVDVDRSILIDSGLGGAGSPATTIEGVGPVGMDQDDVGAV